MTMTLVKLSYNSKLVPDPGLVLQTPLCCGILIPRKCPRKTHFNTEWGEGVQNLKDFCLKNQHMQSKLLNIENWCNERCLKLGIISDLKTDVIKKFQ